MNCSGKDNPPRPDTAAVGSTLGVDPAAVIARTLVLGYGNPLRGDDGAGAAVIERLQRPSPLPEAEGAAATSPLTKAEEVGLLTAHQLMPEHVDELVQADHVIFVDASVEVPAGEVRARTVVADTTGEAATTAHHMTPAVLLGLCEAMYARAPAATTIAIGVEAMGYGEALSPTVDRAVDQAVRHIREMLNARNRAEAIGHA